MQSISKVLKIQLEWKKGSASKMYCIVQNKGETGLSKMKLMRGYIGFQSIGWTVTEYKLVLQIW